MEALDYDNIESPMSPQAQKDLLRKGRLVGRKHMLPEQAASYLRDLIPMTNRVLYVALQNVNAHQSKYTFVSVFVSLDGEINNISFYIAKTLGWRAWERTTDYIRVQNNGNNIGNIVKLALSHALYDNVFLKEKLEYKWV